VLHTIVKIVGVFLTWSLTLREERRLRVFKELLKGCKEGVEESIWT
jgi:hypothetical protein